jgi:hypothetical protein
LRLRTFIGDSSHPARRFLDKWEEREKARSEVPRNAQEEAMIGKWYRIPAVCALAVLAGSFAGTAEAQEKVDHPSLRAALHELRDARSELKSARDAWPPGYRERALRSIDDAVQSVRTILSVKDVDTFRGVDRNPDYYAKHYKDHPRLRAALHDLRAAREELRTAGTNVGNLKERALEDIDIAIGDILVLIRNYKP